MNNKYFIISAMVALTVLLFSTTPGFATILGAGENFAVLGSSTVTNTGSSTVTGDVGVTPGSAIVGFSDTGGPGTVTGTIYGPNAVSLAAHNNALTAWTGLKNMTFTNNLTGLDLGNRTLTSGVYHFDTSAQLTGALTLDAQGLDNAYWNFQIGSTLTTASLSSVTVINPGSNNGVFWQVGTSATLGTGTSFLGNIISDQSVTLNTNADIVGGRVFALNGAVTMDTNDISAFGVDPNHGFSGGFAFLGNGSIGPVPVVTPEPASMALFMSGLGLLGLRFKKNKLT